MHFIPKMKYSTRGHFVSIHTHPIAAKSFIDTNSEINIFLRHLTQDFPTSYILADNKPKISTVFIKQQNSDNRLINNNDKYNSNKMFNQLHRNVQINRQEIAAAIINGIEYQQKIIQISDRRSLIGHITQLLATKTS